MASKIEKIASAPKPPVIPIPWTVQTAIMDDGRTGYQIIGGMREHDVNGKKERSYVVVGTIARAEDAQRICECVNACAHFTKPGETISKLSVNHLIQFMP